MFIGDCEAGAVNWLVEGGLRRRAEEAAGLHEFVFVTAMMDLQKEDMQELVNLWPHNDCCQC